MDWLGTPVLEEQHSNCVPYHPSPSNRRQLGLASSDPDISDEDYSGRLMPSPDRMGVLLITPVRPSGPGDQVGAPVMISDQRKCISFLWVREFLFFFFFPRLKWSLFFWFFDFFLFFVFLNKTVCETAILSPWQSDPWKMH